MIYYTYLILLFLFNLPWRSGRWIYLLPASSRSQKYFHQQLRRSGSKLEHIFKSRCNRIRAPAFYCHFESRFTGCEILFQLRR